MNNLKKVGLTALAGALVSVSANAAELTVTGGASIGFTGEEMVNTGNGWSMNDGLTFAATTEMDNGWNVTATQIIDSSDGASGVIMDTRILTIDMGDSGTLTFAGDGGSSVLDAIDDVTPTANEESFDDVTGADVIPGGTGGNNMFHYSNGSLMDGLTVSASYYAFGDAGKADDRQTAEGGSLAANYSIGQVSVGYGETRHAPAQKMNNTANTVAVQHYDNRAYSIGFAVNDNLSVSYTQEDSEKNQKKKVALANTTTRSDVEMEMQTIDLSYTLGGATLGISQSEVTNDSYTQGDDTKETIFAIALAF